MATPTTKPISKPIFKTSSPFTATKWPQIPQKDQQVILELVCDLITPLGEHRRTYLHPSRGKKRKRGIYIDQNEGNQVTSPPPQPEIGNHILVGLNSVTRHLETLAARNAPSTMPAAHVRRGAKASKVASVNESAGDGDGHTPREDVEEIRLLSMIILTHPEPSLSLAHAHLPTLVHLSTIAPSCTSQSTSTLAPSLDSTTRLIPLATSTEARLASTLHIPRVGALAVFQHAPGSKPLEAFVGENVHKTECRWIDEALRAEWRGLTLQTE